MERFFVLLTKITLLVVMVGSCSNFSTNKMTTYPPTLISIVSSSNGYLVKIRTSNPDIFFFGYRLYIGKNESEARNPASLTAGYECVGGLAEIPNFPREYYLDISNDGTPRQSGALCKFQAPLKSGDVISVRGLLLSIQPNQNTDRLSPSQPSNTLTVP